MQKTKNYVLKYFPKSTNHVIREGMINGKYLKFNAVKPLTDATVEDLRKQGFTKLNIALVDAAGQVGLPDFSIEELQGKL